MFEVGDWRTVVDEVIGRANEADWYVCFLFCSINAERTVADDDCSIAGSTGSICWSLAGVISAQS